MKQLFVFFVLSSLMITSAFSVEVEGELDCIAAAESNTRVNNKSVSSVKPVVKSKTGSTKQ